MSEILIIQLWLVLQKGKVVCRYELIPALWLSVNAVSHVARVGPIRWRAGYFRVLLSWRHIGQFERKGSNLRLFRTCY